MISGRDIVVLSSLDWDSLWQAPQEIAARLGRAGNRVLYVENLGVRTPRLADAGRVAARLRARLRTVRSGGLRPAAPGVWACSPLVLPPFGRPYARRLNRTVLLPALRRASRGLGMRDPLVWTFLPTDTALDAHRMLAAASGPLVYTCLADFGELADRPERLDASERELLRASDVVFARGPELAARCRRSSDAVVEIALGVDLEAFAVAPRADGARSEPVIGYVGALHRHLDVGLAAAAARARPGWRWVYVGPVHAPVDELAALPNVELRGEQPHGRLASEIRSFDVCTIPYRLAADTHTVLPAKLLEYLAAGRPVVSTPLPEVVAFDARSGVVEVADAEPAAFVAAIERALAGDGERERTARRRAVEHLGWDAQLERMSAALAALA